MASTVLSMYAKAISKKPKPENMPDLGDGESAPSEAALAMFGIKLKQ